ncbi:MAG: DoxX family protein [Chloroflexi bacterium]|nr:DoxX family protein [Chloroflexota bacterium]
MLKRLGLLLFSAILISGGWSQMMTPGNRGERARKLGLPVSDEIVRLSGASLLLAAIGVQFKPLRALAGLLVALEIPVFTWVGHRFWEMEPGPARAANRAHFMKNLSLVGAGLYLAGTAGD